MSPFVQFLCWYQIVTSGHLFLPNTLFYHENTQNHVEKPVCIFMSVGGQNILSAPVCVRWHTGRFGSGHAGLNTVWFSIQKRDILQDQQIGILFENVEVNTSTCICAMDIQASDPGSY